MARIESLEEKGAVVCEHASIAIKFLKTTGLNVLDILTKNRLKQMYVAFAVE